MPPEQWVLQGGAGGALLLFVLGFRFGWWRTGFEVEAWKQHAKSQEERAERSEEREAEAAKALMALTEAVHKVLDRGRIRE